MHYIRMQNIPDDEEIPAKALRTRTLEQAEEVKQVSRICERHLFVLTSDFTLDQQTHKPDQVDHLWRCTQGIASSSVRSQDAVRHIFNFGSVIGTSRKIILPVTVSKLAYTVSPPCSFLISARVHAFDSKLWQRKMSNGVFIEGRV